MHHIRRNATGILLCLLIATPAWLLGRAIPLIGSPVFGIVFGMMLTLAFPRLLIEPLRFGSASAKPEKTPPAPLSEGVRYTSKKLLQYAIILLGFEMNLFRVLEVGAQSLFVMLFTLTAAFLTAWLVGRVLGLQGKMTVLIGVGTSICGGSAIAATAPVIGAEDEDVAHAISTIFLFNIVAVFLFPPLGHLLGLGDTGFGLWAGTAINDTSSVVAAGAAWSATAGNHVALSFATVVKLTRTLMIVPITLVLALYMARKSGRSAEGSTFHFAKVFPWFVLGFVAATIVNTFAGLPAFVSEGCVTAGKFVIVMAMSAIGLNTHLGKLFKNGGKPIALGLCCWAAVTGTSLLVQALTGSL